MSITWFPTRVVREAITPLLAALVTTGWMAASAEGVGEPPYDPPVDVRSRIEALFSKTGTAVSYFVGPSGLIGVGLTQRNGQQSVAFATADGGVLIAGVVIDTKSASNLAPKYLAALPAPDMNPIMDDLLSKAVGVEQGDEGDADFVVFVDPMCGYCARAYDSFQRLLLARPQVSVKWVPVGILGPSSQNKASAVLGSGEDEAHQLLADLMAKKRLTVVAEQAVNGQGALKTNESLFAEYQFSSVPVVVSRLRGEVAVELGAPTFESLIAAVDGEETQERAGSR